MTHSFICPFIYLFIYLFVHSFICSFIYLFIHLFVHSFISSCNSPPTHLLTYFSPPISASPHPHPHPHPPPPPIPSPHPSVYSPSSIPSILHPFLLFILGEGAEESLYWVAYATQQSLKLPATPNTNLETSNPILDSENGTSVTSAAQRAAENLLGEVFQHYDIYVIFHLIMR